MSNFDVLLADANRKLADANSFQLIQHASTLTVRDTVRDIPMVLPVAAFSENIENEDFDNSAKLARAHDYIRSHGILRIMPLVASFGYWSGADGPIECLLWPMDSATLRTGLPDMHLTHHKPASEVAALRAEITEPMRVKHDVVSGFVWAGEELPTTAVLRTHKALPDTHMEAIERTSKISIPILVNDRLLVTT